MIAPIALALIGLIGPVVAFQTGRFTGPVHRANRIESLSKVLDSIDPASPDAAALFTIRHRLIQDEHYRVFGTKLDMPFRLLSTVNFAVGLATIVSSSLDFPDARSAAYLILAQLTVVIVLSIVGYIRKRQHRNYINNFGSILEIR